LDSTILDKQNKQAINLLCKLPLVKQWKLQYRATRDGFSAQNFHTKCDTAANTLTIIKSTNGNIFGGFTENAWKSTGGYYNDQKAFIFSLDNKENKPFKVMCSYGACAISCNSIHGPTFGGMGQHLEEDMTFIFHRIPTRIKRVNLILDILISMLIINMVRKKQSLF